MTDLDLNPDGPHSPERTAEVAAIFDACSRFLVYATMGRAAGLEYPDEAYRLLGELYSATSRLSQVCNQLEGFLAGQLATGRLGVAGQFGGQELAVDRAALHLGQAAKHAADLTAALQIVQGDISRLYVRPGADE